MNKLKLVFLIPVIVLNLISVFLTNTDTLPKDVLPSVMIWLNYTVLAFAIGLIICVAIEMKKSREEHKAKLLDNE